MNIPADQAPIKVNINRKVRVRLTPEGRTAHLVDHVSFWARLGRSQTYQLPQEDENGWSEWQLWTLMQAFGAHIMMGGPVPFETEIELLPDVTL